MTNLRPPIKSKADALANPAPGDRWRVKDEIQPNFFYELRVEWPASFPSFVVGIRFTGERCFGRPDEPMRYQLWQFREWVKDAEYLGPSERP